MLKMDDNLTSNYLCNASAYEQSIEYAEPISIIRIVTSSLSVIGSTSIIIAVFLTGKLSNPEVHPLFTLSVADFIISCTWVFGGAVWIYNEGHYTSDATPGQLGNGLGLCYVLSIATVILSITTYLLTTVYAAHALIKTREIYNNKGRHTMDTSRSCCRHLTTGILYILCWGLPAVLVLPVSEHYVGINSIGEACWCVVDFFNTRPDNADLYDFTKFDELAVVIATFNGTFFLLCAVLMTVIYSVTLYLAWKILKMQRTTTQIDKHATKIIKKLITRVSVFVGIFFVCGLPAFIGSCIVWGEDRALALWETPDKTVLFLQAIVGPLQGILNALFYGWSRKEFRKAIRVKVKVHLKPARKNTDESDAGLINVRQSHSYSN